MYLYNVMRKKRGKYDTGCLLLGTGYSLLDYAPNTHRMSGKRKLATGKPIKHERTDAPAITKNWLWDWASPITK